jgi:hypothetical protein
MDVKDLYSTFQSPKGQTTLFRSTQQTHSKSEFVDQTLQLPSINQAFSQRTIEILMKNTKSGFANRKGSSVCDPRLKKQNELFFN